MISDPDRKMAVELIREAKEDGCRLKLACQELNISVRTYERWTRNEGVESDQRPLAKRPTPKNKLSDEERKQVIEAVNSPQYAERNSW